MSDACLLHATACEDFADYCAQWPHEDCCRDAQNAACLRRCLPYMRDAGGRMTRVRTLAGGLELLRRWFNDQSAYPRMLAIQSPAGALCVRGARGALEPLFRLKVPDFRMAWTLIDMVPADSLTTANASAARINDFRTAGTSSTPCAC